MVYYVLFAGSKNYSSIVVVVFLSILGTLKPNEHFRNIFLAFLVNIGNHKHKIDTFWQIKIVSYKPILSNINPYKQKSTIKIDGK